MGRYSFEKYQGGRGRHTCPSCGGRREFTRYVDEFGSPVDETVGICNRKDSCGYHLSPYDVHVHAVNTRTSERREQMNTMNTVNKMNIVNKMNAYGEIDKSYLTRSFAHTGENRFFKYLASFIPKEIIEEAIRKYLVGTTKQGETVFWLIDKSGILRGGKVIMYDERTGKRDKSKGANSIVAKLKKANVLPESFTQFSCLFGEHLLKDREKTIAVVEAEKTAFVASMFLPKYLWLAVGSKDWINNMERMAPLKKRKVVLFPDLGAFEVWKNFETKARQMGFQVSTSTLLEDKATDEHRRNQWDLADYLLGNEKQTVEWNRYADDYNLKLDRVKAHGFSDEYLEELKAERLAVMEKDELTDADVRSIVMGMKTEEFYELD